LIVWALFDSGNGSYTKVVEKYFKGDVKIYPIGIDIENKNDHFINLNLADFGYLFGDNSTYDKLDRLPRPQLIIASPPCESWSVASAMAGGNACWKQEVGGDLFVPQVPLSRFTVRSYKDYKGYQFIPEKSLINRINGELTIFNTIQIIKKYKPKYYIIENPAYGRIWDYIKEILGFVIPYENLTYYNNYGFPISKPTKFGSNIDLKLKKDKKPNKINFNEVRGYNERSNIPELLVKDIFKKVIEKETK